MSNSNITGIVTSKAVFYAMEPATLERYASFKDYISEMSIGLSHDEIKRISAQVQQAREDSRDSFFVDDSGAAHIMVSGPLEPKPDACAIMFGIDMTTYADIINETRTAEGDNNINKIVYHFDTPGGNVTGLFKAADEIREASKPTVAIIDGLCASAGYALASQCDEIIATNISEEIGSIGVVTEIIDRSGQEEGRGIKRYILTSENAENKRPDVTTEEGRDKIISRLTNLESVFVEYVAVGRKTTVDNVLTDFGRGAVFIARKARDVGMIDDIESEIQTEPRNTTVTEPQIEGEDTMGDVTMTEEQLEKFAADVAAKTAASVKTEMTAEMDAREDARKAESERMAGFAKLKEKYPEMSAMIDEESKKEGASADLDFAMKVADADKAREAAAGEQQDAAGDQAADTKPSGNQPKDNSGNEALASMKGRM